jgi:hypothetical protein
MSKRNFTEIILLGLARKICLREFLLALPDLWASIEIYTHDLAIVKIKCYLHALYTESIKLISTN